MTTTYHGWRRGLATAPARCAEKSGAAFEIYARPLPAPLRWFAAAFRLIR